MAELRSIVDEDDFKAHVLDASGPVLVDFWSESCRPCLAMLPVLEAIASEKEGAVEIIKVDVAQCPEIAARHGIASVPAMVLYNRGSVVEKIAGAQTKAAIVSHVNAL